MLLSQAFFAIFYLFAIFYQVVGQIAHNRRIFSVNGYLSRKDQSGPWSPHDDIIGMVHSIGDLGVDVENGKIFHAEREDAGVNIESARQLSLTALPGRCRYFWGGVLLRTL